MPVVKDNSVSSWSQYNLTVTGTGWTTTRAKGVPYKTLDGTWRLKFNINGSVTSAARTQYDVFIANVGATNQAISFTSSAATSLQYGYALTSGTDIRLRVGHASATTVAYTYAGDIELESKPTWAIDYSI